jgi:putative membrane protein
VLAYGKALAATPFDEQFMRFEAEGSTYELAFARLGEARAVRPDVRAYASMVVNDHEAYNGALRDLAKLKRIVIPSSMDGEGERRLGRLANMRGAKFDAAFVREARRVNGENIRELRMEASQTTDPDIQRFVKRFLKVDEKHEADARALSERIVVLRTQVVPVLPTGQR